MDINIVLLEPEIPQNTGNIARTCAAVGANLHLIEPLGFSIDEKQVRRAGLDYWKYLKLKTYSNIEDFYKQNPDANCYYVSTKAPNIYSDVKYAENPFFIFGKESAGIPENILYKNKNNCIRIPMKEEARSLNLSNSAAIIAYEALRQIDFINLKKTGELTKYSWD